MRVLKYLAAFWVAVAVYCVLSLFYGATGFSAYKQMLEGRDIQWANMTELGAINSGLENARNNLLYDRDTIAMYARSLGYGADDERFVRIVGLGGIKNPHTTAGEIIRTEPPAFISDRIIKMSALFAGIAVMALLFVFDMLRRR